MPLERFGENFSEIESPRPIFLKKIDNATYDLEPTLRASLVLASIAAVTGLLVGVKFLKHFKEKIQNPRGERVASL